MSLQLAFFSKLVYKSIYVVIFCIIIDIYNIYMYVVEALRSNGTPIYATLPPPHVGGSLLQEIFFSKSFYAFL